MSRNFYSAFKSIITAAISLAAFSCSPCYSEEDFSFEECNCDCCSSRCFSHFDALIWIPHISGLEWGFGSTYVEENQHDCARIFSTEDKEIDPHFDLNAGFRVGVGTGCDPWVTKLDWTHFSSTGGRRCHYSETEFATGHLKIQLDQLDLIATYFCDLTTPFSIYPFIGLRSSWLKQKLCSEFDTKIMVGNNSCTIEKSEFEGKQRYFGIGPILGLGVSWEVNPCIELFSSLSAAILYGKYHIHQMESEMFTRPISTAAKHTRSKRISAFDPNLNFDIGFVCHLFLFDCVDMDIVTALEHHQYFNHVKFGLRDGDLTFSGGSLSLLFGF